MLTFCQFHWQLVYESLLCVVSLHLKGNPALKIVLGRLVKGKDVLHRLPRAVNSFKRLKAKRGGHQRGRGGIVQRNGLDCHSPILGLSRDGDIPRSSHRFEILSFRREVHLEWGLPGVGVVETLARLQHHILEDQLFLLGFSHRGHVVCAKHEANRAHVGAFAPIGECNYHHVGAFGVEGSLGHRGLDSAFPRVIVASLELTAGLLDDNIAGRRAGHAQRLPLRASLKLVEGIEQVGAVGARGEIVGANGLGVIPAIVPAPKDLREREQIALQHIHRGILLLLNDPKAETGPLLTHADIEGLHADAGHQAAHGLHVEHVAHKLGRILQRVVWRVGHRAHQDGLLIPIAPLAGARAGSLVHWLHIREQVVAIGYAAPPPVEVVVAIPIVAVAHEGVSTTVAGLLPAVEDGLPGLELPLQQGRPLRQRVESPVLDEHLGAIVHIGSQRVLGILRPRGALVLAIEHVAADAHLVHQLGHRLLLLSTFRPAVGRKHVDPVKGLHA